MAADLYLLGACARGDSLFLRLYHWERPTVTYGYMQNAADLLDREYCETQGAQWIRRPTGGRAVLHHQDLTYSCVFAHDLKQLGQSVAESYRILSDCLIAGFAIAGIDAKAHDSSFDTASARSEQRLPCFLAPNRDEIMAGGKKLVGSAQKRTAAGVLQHGSIPLTPAFRQLPRYQKMTDRERAIQMRLLEQKCVCVEEIAPDLDIKALSAAMQRGFAERLNVSSEHRSWSEREREGIESLARSAAFREQWLSPANPVWQWAY